MNVNLWTIITVNDVVPLKRSLPYIFIDAYCLPSVDYFAFSMLCFLLQNADQVRSSFLLCLLSSESSRRMSLSVLVVFVAETIIFYCSHSTYIWVP